MGALTEQVQTDIEKANASGLTPVVFVHGLWLLPSSWDRWRALFEAEGYATIAPGWPDDPDTVEEARAHPEVFAKKGLDVITANYMAAIEKLKLQPVVIGHSFGGVIAQMLAGDGLSRATVAIDPAQFRGVLPLPLSQLKSGAPVLGNPTNYGKAVTLTFEQFNYGWTNALDEAEARELYETYHVAGSGVPLFQAAAANFNPWSEDSVDTKNPDRGPLLFISGLEDHTVPWAVASAAFEIQAKNPGLTQIVAIEGRGHSLIIDHGWKDVADEALYFVNENAGDS
ncbi:MAG: alpha/beta hydrolase [Glaciihabitans sp.]|nr:alpha/beta hydrolase [Glaciihabitans sp.]